MPLGKDRQLTVLGRETAAPPVRTCGQEQLTSGWGASPGPEVNQRWRMSESCLGAVSLGCSGPIWQKGKDMPNAVSAWSGGNTGWCQCPEPSELECFHLWFYNASTCLLHRQVVTGRAGLQQECTFRWENIRMPLYRLGNSHCPELPRCLSASPGTLGTSL